MNTTELLEIACSQEASGNAKVVEFLSTLPTLSESNKREITEQLLEVVVNARQQLLKRLQAADLIGGQSKVLGIQGNLFVAERLLDTFQREFIPIEEVAFRSDNSAKLAQLRDLELMFCESLAYAVLVTSFSQGERIANAVIKMAAGSEIACSLAKLLEKARTAKLQGKLAS